jgi:hypothetical protein
MMGTVRRKASFSQDAVLFGLLVMIEPGMDRKSKQVAFKKQGLRLMSGWDGVKIFLCRHRERKRLAA